MIKIERLFENHFDDPEISLDKLRAFTDDHLKRLAANNSDTRYDEMINETEAIYQIFFGHLVEKKTSDALQQSRTKSMNLVHNELMQFIRRREGTISSEFGENSPQYQEFYPLGITEYNESTLATIEALAKRMAAAVTTHAAKLGAAFGTELNQLINRFTAARGSQLTQKGTLSENRNTARSARNPLEMQLMKNVLTLALEYIGNTAAAKQFFDQQIIEGKSAPGKTQEPPPSTSLN